MNKTIKRDIRMFRGKEGRGVFVKKDKTMEFTFVVYKKRK